VYRAQTTLTLNSFAHCKGMDERIFNQNINRNI
jgi:hypothetical protein